MECASCKTGTTEKGTVTITLERNDAVVFLKNVPVELCINCGNYYLLKEITREGIFLFKRNLPYTFHLFAACLIQNGLYCVNAFAKRSVTFY
jgi:YgiT-type zinc finger domain-containing protein